MKATLVNGRCRRRCRDRRRRYHRCRPPPPRPPTLLLHPPPLPTPLPPPAPTQKMTKMFTRALRALYARDTDTQPRLKKRNLAVLKKPLGCARARAHVRAVCSVCARVRALAHALCVLVLFCGSLLLVVCKTNTENHPNA